MGNFNRERRGGDRKFGGGRSFGRQGGDRRDREMFRATCAECGRDCEVPFRPTGDKPVFCSDCFSRGGERERRPERRDSRRNDSGDREMFAAICDGCHKECEVPFRPVSGKPIYCKGCFGGGKDDAKKSNEVINKLNEQFEILNTKLDKILEKLATKTSAKVIQVDTEKRATKKSAVADLSLSSEARPKVNEERASAERAPVKKPATAKQKVAKKKVAAKKTVTRKKK